MVYSLVNNARCGFPASNGQLLCPLDFCQHRQPQRTVRRIFYLLNQLLTTGSGEAHHDVRWISTARSDYQSLTAEIAAISAPHCPVMLRLPSRRRAAFVPLFAPATP